jgi:hypothetical protein
LPFPMSATVFLLVNVPNTAARHPYREDLQQCG